MDICITIPYPGSETMTPIWAEEEKTIDFRREPQRAARCTLAFAATELKSFLSRTLTTCAISFVSQAPEDSFHIGLKIIEDASKNERFSLEPLPNGILITGQGRTGLLYGAYEYLRMQGWRWFAPGKGGEIIPPYRDHLAAPKEKQEFGPSFSLGRGFDFECVSMESADLLLWMARNRLNVCGYRPATGPLGSKLGMTFKVGGHIFEKILDPDRTTRSGKTLWDEHPTWYGQPAHGKRTKEKALTTQFCISQPNLLEFLAEELLTHVMGDWRQADRIDVWGFDTWGSTCTCEECQRRGNGTDQTLFFLSALRSVLDRASQEGRLDHPVQMVMCAYEGTSTIQGPKNPLPENLVRSGDYATFYPINRCYAHDFADGACLTNQFYHNALASWFVRAPTLPVTIGEYYNVSKFEDLPALFTSRIIHDIPRYFKSGARGITYMHLPMVNWGLRTLTQVLYAQMAWNIDSRPETFVKEYFEKWYGPYAEEMTEVYRRVERAWISISDWRAWDRRSVLSQLQKWDGERPNSPLPMDNHFGTAAGAIKSGRISVRLLKQAKNILTRVRERERQDYAIQPSMAMTNTAVNPIGARRQEVLNQYEQRLSEDGRLLRYGLDTMLLMTELAAYYDSLYRQDAKAAESAWRTVERTAESLDSYYIPLRFEWPGAGYQSPDALTRTQLRELVRRCRKFRMKPPRDS